MAHGLIEAVGQVHYKHDAGRSDEELYRMGYNRVYDTLEMETNLDYAEAVFKHVLDRLDTTQPLSSAVLCRRTGKTSGRGDGPAGNITECLSQGRSSIHPRLY